MFMMNLTISSSKIVGLAIYGAVLTKHQEISYKVDPRSASTVILIHLRSTWE